MCCHSYTLFGSRCSFGSGADGPSPQAGVAYSVEYQFMGVHGSRSVLLRRPVHCLYALQGHVIDPSAFPADKVIMPGSVVVEVVRPCCITEFFDLSTFGKQVQIPVNRSETDARKLPADRRIHLIRRGMGCISHKEFPDCLPLSRILYCFHIRLRYQSAFQKQ